MPPSFARAITAMPHAARTASPTAARFLPEIARMLVVKEELPGSHESPQEVLRVLRAIGGCLEQRRRLCQLVRRRLATQRAQVQPAHEILVRLRVLDDRVDRLAAP